MSPFWLFLIIPLCFTCGYAFCGMMTTNSQIERCQRCIYNKEQEENKEAE